jgi:hypothetical protein
LQQLVHVAKRYGPSIRRNLEHLEVGVDLPSGEAAVSTDATRGSLGAQEEPGDGHGGRELPNVRSPADEIRVAEPSLLEASLNQVDDPTMPDDVWWAGA